VFFFKKKIPESKSTLKENVASNPEKGKKQAKEYQSYLGS